MGSIRVVDIEYYGVFPRASEDEFGMVVIYECPDGSMHLESCQGADHRGLARRLIECRIAAHVDVWVWHAPAGGQREALLRVKYSPAEKARGGRVFLEHVTLPGGEPVFLAVVRNEKMKTLVDATGQEQKILLSCRIDVPSNRRDEICGVLQSLWDATGSIVKAGLALDLTAV